MTPRRDIAAIHISASASEIIELSKKSRFSRFPVYSTNIDAIQGFFYIKDFLFSPEYLDGSAAFQVSAYLRKPLFVFETTKLAQVEKKFHTEQQTMAIVLDEYGGTAGLITVEDVSEEIFGSILDEYDVRAGVNTHTAAADINIHADTAEAAQVIPDNTSTALPTVRKSGQAAAIAATEADASSATNEFGITPTEIASKSMPTSTSPIAPVRTGADGIGGDNTGTARNEAEEQEAFTIVGITRLADLNEKLNLNLESQYSDTIGGYIMEKAGEIPAAGYSISIEPYLFTVTKVEANRIEHVEVRMQAEE